jgi:hypothetical protein
LPAECWDLLAPWLPTPPPPDWAPTHCACKPYILALYAQRGMPLVPAWWALPDGRCACGDACCKQAGKHPLTDPALGLLHGLKDATCDLRVILRWHERYPDANWAARTGDLCDALDADPKYNGLQSLERLRRELGGLPELDRTWAQETGSGGLHILFQARAGIRNRVSAKTLGPGLDIRGTGGYIIICPSNHRDNPTVCAYNWLRNPIEHPLLPWPQPLVDRLLPPKRTPVRVPRPAPDWLRTHQREAPEWLLARLKRGAKEGTRNDEAFKFGCAARRTVSDPHLARNLFEQFCFNCAPALDEREMERVWRSCCERQAYEPVRQPLALRPEARIARL